MELTELTEVVLHHRMRPYHFPLLVLAPSTDSFSLVLPGRGLGETPNGLESLFYSEIVEHDARFVIKETTRGDNNGGRKSTVTASGIPRVENKEGQRMAGTRLTVVNAGQ